MKSFGIPRSRIFDSHSVSFLSGIMRETNGRGVDLVLNSLAGELLRASWKCVAQFGKLLEIGKRDILGHGMLDLNGFQGCRSYCGFDLYSVAHHDAETLRWYVVPTHLVEAFQELKCSTRALEKAISDLEETTYRPLHTVFQVDQVEDAMRQMQKGQHIGKFIIEIPDNESKYPLLPAQARFSFSPTSSYLLVGGLRGIGRAVVRWMVEHGARDFVFLSRSAGSLEEDHIFAQELETQGCHVVLVAGSVADADTVQRAIQNNGRPVSGVIQMSAVLKVIRSVMQLTDCKLLTRYAGPTIRQDVIRRLDHKSGNQGPRDLEPSQCSPGPITRIFHCLQLRSQHDWKPRTGQLCGSKLVLGWICTVSSRTRLTRIVGQPWARG